MNKAIFFSKREINIRMVISIILIINIAGCSHNKNNCFEAFGGSILWNKYLTIKFDDKFKQNRPPSCTKNEKFASFLVGFRVFDERLKLEEGNSAVMQFNLVSFADKLITDQIDDVVNSFSKKQLSEVQNIGKDNTRFSRVYSKIGHITKDKDKICRIVVTSVKDFKAKNMPPDHQYLLQNDIYKTCFLKNYDQVIVLSVSYRVTPDLAKVFWPQDAIENLNLESLNVIMNNGKSLGHIIRTETQEIYNLLL